MRNLLLLISKYGTLVLFIILELICLFLIVRYNNKQNEIFLYSSNLVSSNLSEKYDKATDYFDLTTYNDSILAENARILELLYKQNTSFNIGIKPSVNDIADSTESDFTFIPANIVSKTIHMRNNRMTLDKGNEDGVFEGMGVVCEKGIVGVVKSANSHFASVIPLINTQLLISAKIKSKNFFGDISWIPYDERYVQLRNIPKHATLNMGDTIETSGYSTVFPPGINIGVVDDIKLPSGGNYFDIRVRLNNRFANMEHTYVVDYTLKDLRLQMDNDF